MILTIIVESLFKVDFREKIILKLTYFGISAFWLVQLKITISS